jgi:hypothetical protein
MVNNKRINNEIRYIIFQDLSVSLRLYWLICELTIYEVIFIGLMPVTPEGS